MSDFFEVYNLFQKYNKEDNGPMTAFWGIYLEMVPFTMTFFKATGEGN